MGAELVPIDPCAVEIHPLSLSLPTTGSRSLETQRGARLWRSYVILPLPIKRRFLLMLLVLASTDVHGSYS